MSIKAIFPAGVIDITVNGLHQWDYGQQLEITAEGLPADVEVHFACAGMREAVVRNCSKVGGSYTAAIPDRCLEQTTPVVAWVYAVGETAGQTILTVTLPIIARAQPQPGATVPETASDKYTEAIEAMNALVEEVGKALANTEAAVLSDVSAAIASGALAVAEASHAVKATDADYATEAFSAHECDFADQAEKAGALTGRTTTPKDGAEEVVISEPGVYLVQYRLHNDDSTVRRVSVLPVLSMIEDVTQPVAADRYLCYKAGTKKIHMSANPSGILCTAYFLRLVRLAIV
jgi:hypothetical protein